LAIAWVKVMTSLTSYNGKFPYFMALKATSKFRLSAWLSKRKFLTNGILFFIKWGLSDDGVTE